MSRSGSRSGSLRIALSRPRRPWRDGDTDATEESAVSSLEVDSDTPSEDAGPDRSEARSSIDTANDVRGPLSKADVVASGRPRPCMVLLSVLPIERMMTG
jgi:hypothetical protein